MSIWHLQNEPYEAMIDGTKKLEARVDDEERQKVDIGSKIIFVNNDTGCRLERTVIGITLYGKRGPKTNEDVVSIIDDMLVTEGYENLTPWLSSIEESRELYLRFYRNKLAVYGVMAVFLLE